MWEWDLCVWGSPSGQEQVRSAEQTCSCFKYDFERGYFLVTLLPLSSGTCSFSPDNRLRSHHGVSKGKQGIQKLNFQAVIKSAASAASRKHKSREGSSRGVPRSRRPPAEAVVLHFPGASFPGFGLPGGCASSRLDHGLKV